MKWIWYGTDVPSYYKLDSFYLNYNELVYERYKFEAPRWRKVVSFELMLPFANLLERFSNDCRKTKTKAITPTNHNRSSRRDEQIKVPSNYQ